MKYREPFFKRLTRGEMRYVKQNGVSSIMLTKVKDTSIPTWNNLVWEIFNVPAPENPFDVLWHFYLQQIIETDWLYTNPTLFLRGADYETIHVTDVMITIYVRFWLHGGRWVTVPFPLYNTTLESIDHTRRMASILNQFAANRINV